jgi:phosphatidylserine decarboxylase
MKQKINNFIFSTSSFTIQLRESDRRFLGGGPGPMSTQFDSPRMTTAEERLLPARGRLPITRMGLKEVLLFGGSVTLIAVGLAIWRPWAALPPALLASFIVWFFRDPHRVVPTGPGLLVSPADGVVTHVEELSEAGVWDGPAIKISIYLSLFSVHLNRVPEQARLLEVQHLPGRHLCTRDPRSAEVNEQCRTLWESLDLPALRFLVKQIAGPLVSSIVCAVHPGVVLPRGARFGMIKFGSRTELYLPRHPGLCLAVRPGDRVRAGTSILARLSA